MANQAEATKIVSYASVGGDDSAVAPKIVMYVVATPSDAADTSNRQGHVHTQIIVRSS